MRVVVDDRQVMAPEISPDSMLPNAHSASSGPDQALWPSSSERATVATSALPNSTPSAIPTPVSGASTSQGIRGPVARSRRRGLAGGWVRRCAASASVPDTPATTAVVRPARGCQDVASRVTVVGPRMNTTSSFTASSEYAVCISPRSSRRCAQRARTHEPIGGRLAPAVAANTCGSGSGQSACTDHIISAIEIANDVVAHGRNRPCPSRSINRPCTIAKAASAMMHAADTDPASE